MKIETASIPASYRSREGKYAAVYRALADTDGTSAIRLIGLDERAGQTLTMATRYYFRRANSPWTVASRREGSDIVMWLRPKTKVEALPVTREFAEVR